jgi:hypothetical protein
LKLFVVVGSDSASRVVSNFPPPGASSVLDGNELAAPRVDESRICGRSEKELFVGDVSDDVEDTDEELRWRTEGSVGPGEGEGDGEGKDVNILGAGRMSVDGPASLVAAEGTVI